MFDIGFPELMLVAVVVLLVLGPERLPQTLRTAGLWLGRLQRSFTSVKAEIEREIGMDEVRRQLHNEGVMAEMKKLQDDLQAAAEPPFAGSGEMNSILPEDLRKPDDNAAATTVPTSQGSDGPDDPTRTASAASRRDDGGSVPSSNSSNHSNNAATRRQPDHR